MSNAEGGVVIKNQASQTKPIADNPSKTIAMYLRILNIKAGCPAKFLSPRTAAQNLPLSFFHSLLGGTFSVVSQCSMIFPSATRK